METNYLLDDYAKQYGRSRDSNFAIACYDQNSIDELENATLENADSGDMDAWGISAQEWVDAIRAARNEKLDI